MISDDKRADILAAHYAERCEGLSKRIDLRTRLGLACALTWTLVLYKVYDPSQFSKLTTGFLAKYTETKETQAPQWFVGSLLWFALVFMVIELYVASTHIEIDAAYLRRLERDLARLTGPDFPSVWCGPGPKPKLFRQSNRFYSFLMPTLVLLTLSYVISREVWMAVHAPGWTFVFSALDTVFATAVVYFSVLWLRSVEKPAHG